VELAEEVHLVPESVVGLTEMKEPGLELPAVGNALLSTKQSMRET
jgi:hypothetical protein